MIEEKRKHNDFIYVQYFRPFYLSSGVYFFFNAHICLCTFQRGGRPARLYSHSHNWEKGLTEPGAQVERKECLDDQTTICPERQSPGHYKSQDQMNQHIGIYYLYFGQISQQVEIGSFESIFREQYRATYMYMYTKIDPII